MEQFYGILLQAEGHWIKYQMHNDEKPWADSQIKDCWCFRHFKIDFCFLFPPLLKENLHWWEADLTVVMISFSLITCCVSISILKVQTNFFLNKNLEDVLF